MISTWYTPVNDTEMQRGLQKKRKIREIYRTFKLMYDKNKSASNSQEN